MGDAIETMTARPAAGAWPKQVRLFVGGRWESAASGATVPRVSPATGELIAQLAVASTEDVGRAVAAARLGKERLAALNAYERGRLVGRIAERIEAHRDDIAMALSLDQGKPFRTEALLEATNCARHYREAAEGVVRLETTVVPSRDPNKRVIALREARGVYAVITPWNFPANIPSEYFGAALATGNAVVWKPASTSSVVAAVLTECFIEAELPEGAFNMILGPGSTIGEELVAHPGVDAVGFTGESSTGERIAARAGLKSLLLELGGNGPTIILEDADLDAAARAVAVASFKNAGQICSASERILVDAHVHDAFAERLLGEAKAVRLGHPLADGTTMGPMNNSSTVDKVARHIEDARARGASVLLGGRRAVGFPTDLYFEPTVLDGVTPEMEVFREETFGPVAPMTTFQTQAEALELANSSPFGLAGSVWTSDLRAAFLLAERLQVGYVVVNDGSHYWEPQLPTGGAPGKKSGIGRLGGRAVLEAMTEVKTVVIDLRNVPTRGSLP